MFKRIHFLLFYLIFLSSIFVSCSAKEQKEIKTPGLLTVGMDLSYPPFETVDTQGNPAGFSVEMAQDLAKYLGLALKIENTAWSGLIAGLQTGSFDIVLSSLTKTPEREKSINFSTPYAHVGLSLLFSQKSLYKDEDALKQAGEKANIIVRKGTVGESIAHNIFPKANISVVESLPAMILEVSQNKVDALLYDIITVNELYHKNPKTTFTDLKIVTGSAGSWAIGLKKENTALTTKIDQFIEQYRKDGQFTKLSKKYLQGFDTIFNL